MQAEAAIVEDSGVEGRHETNGNILVEDVDLSEPTEGEVLVDMKATGVCHSDYHICTDDVPVTHYPHVLGHEGAGVVEAVGEGVSRVEPGDHVALMFIPGCGTCPACAQGHQQICDNTQYLAHGHMDGRFRVHRDGEGVGQFALLGALSSATVVNEESVVPIPDDVPFDVACLTSCGVATGFGAAAQRADINPGDTVVHFGFGGVGANAVQGSVAKGASRIIVVDPVERKREFAEEFGATHVVDPEEEDPVEAVEELTDGRMADTAVVTVDVVLPETVGTALASVGGRGEAVVVSIAGHEADHIDMGGVGVSSIVGAEKELKGVSYGGWSPNFAIPRLLEMYQHETLLLDELVTTRYSLDEVNDAFDDMLSGRNIRGVVEF